MGDPLSRSIPAPVSACDLGLTTLFGGSINPGRQSANCFIFLCKMESLVQRGARRADDFLIGFMEADADDDTRRRIFPMRSDVEMLWQVLSNLIGNAIKYRKEDGPSLVRISMEEKDEALQIRVEDNGIGLSEEEKERAFERFFQASPSMEGIGVGLSIARTIVNDLGGMIWIESEGKGRGCRSHCLSTPPLKGGWTAAPSVQR